MHDDGVLAVTYISSEDYEATGASEVLTEGIIDHLRTLDGTLVAAVVRDQPERGRAGRKVSLRSTDGRVDVSAIAREQGGGGHQRAAGFGTDLTTPRSSSSCAPRSARRSERRGLDRRPAGATSPPGPPPTTWSRASAASGTAPRPATPARWTPSRPGLLIVLLGQGHQAAALPAGPSQDLRRHRPPGLAFEHRGPRRRADRDGDGPRSARAPDRRGHPAGADDLRGQGRGRAALQEGSSRRGGRDPDPDGHRPPRGAAEATRSAPASRSSARRAPTSAP